MSKLTQLGFIKYKQELIEGIAKACVVKAKEKPKSIEEWLAFMKFSVTRIKQGKKVKYYLGYGYSGNKGSKPLLLVGKANEDLGEFEQSMREQFNTIGQ